MQRLRAMRQEWIGLALIVLASLVLLGLFSITPGTLNDGLAVLMRQVFGLGAVPVGLFIAILGSYLLVDGLHRRWNERVAPPRPLRWDAVVCGEVLFLAALGLVHLLAERDDALGLARAGGGGGLLGWGIRTALVDLLGETASGLLLLSMMLGALGMLIRLLVGPIRWRAPIPGTTEAPSATEALPAETPERPARLRLRPEIKTLPINTQTPQPKRPARRSRHLPPLDLLIPSSKEPVTSADVRYQAQIIEETLHAFGVPARVREINVGPAVTQFGVEPGYIERTASDGSVLRQRVRVSKITALVNDLSLALSAAPIRIEAPVPGRPLVGIEVPNSKVTLVSLRGVLESDAFHKARSKGVLPIALGRDVSGAPVVADLAAMPHLLIAGATGSGKSVCINAILTGLLCEHTPEELNLLLIDPKMVELVPFSGIPHLLAPVVTDLEQVVGALSWIVRMMDERYQLFARCGARHIADYNKRVARQEDADPLPYVVVVIDELADLMMTAPDEVERAITRIAQMARATGIHMIIATQRPSVDVVTGLIKANFPARIAFMVTSQIDSRVILDTAGAERLLGRGDALLMLPEVAKLQRLQGCFVSDEEIRRVVDFWKEQADNGNAETPQHFPWDGLLDEAERDPLLDEAIELVLKTGRVSTSWLQRRLNIGYPRAARLMDQMEEEGIIGPAVNGQPRIVLTRDRLPDDVDDAESGTV
ncbi:MAG: DNA translocase FtsK [Anaerolineae bacterium]